MQPSISEYYRQLIVPRVSTAIEKESDAQILGSDPDQLAAYYFDLFALSPIAEDPHNPPSADPQHYFSRIPAGQREGPYQYQGDILDFRCERVVVEVPILENSHVETIAGLVGNTTSISYSSSDFVWANSRITGVVETKGYGFDRSADEIAGLINQAVGRIRDMVRWRNESIANENNSLKQVILQLISSRKQQITNNASKLAELTKKISIPLKTKMLTGAQPVQLVPRPLVRRIKPQPSLPVEYVLDKDRVTDVIHYLDSQAKGFESASQAIRNLGEEDLRDILLTNLNSIFQGSATGETFSKKGKSDIYLQITEGNILICECKVWGGAELYKKTISQLRGYLTWRHNYGIMITFVRQKGFTRAIEEAGKAIQSDASYVSAFGIVDATHLTSSHQVDDDQKEVTIHHLFYHLVEHS